MGSTNTNTNSNVQQEVAASAIAKSADETHDEGRTWEEIAIPVPWGTVAGKWWGPRNQQQPILALHGWQDNAGTFDRLIPLLPAALGPLLCIDLPGHGRSSHYPPGMQYYLFWDGIALVRRIVRHFNWTAPLTLLGHSLGGALSYMYAASFPADVQRLICIDIAGPTIRNAQKLAAGTGAAIDRALHYETLPVAKMPCYRYEEMIDLVVDAYAGSVNRESAKVLMRRGMAPKPGQTAEQQQQQAPEEGSFHFSRDLRLKVSGLAMFTIEQVLCYAAQIRCEVLCIRGRPGMDFGDESTYTRMVDAMRVAAKRLVFAEVEGTHHLHLDTPERVAPVIEEFLRAAAVTKEAEEEELADIV